MLVALLRALAYNRRPACLCGRETTNMCRAVQSKPTPVCRTYNDCVLGICFILTKFIIGPALTAIDRCTFGWWTNFWRWHPCVTCMFVISEGMERVKRGIQYFWCSKVNIGSRQCSEGSTKGICPPVFLQSVSLFAEILGSHTVLSMCLQTGQTNESLASTHLPCAIIGKVSLHIIRESGVGTHLG